MKDQEMKKILEMMEQKLQNLRPLVGQYEAKVADLEARLEKARIEAKETRDKVESLEMAMDALKLSDGDEEAIVVTEPKATDKKIVTVVEVNPDNTVKTVESREINVSKKKDIDWRHKDACVVKINRYDNIDDRWRSQKAAARALNWSQSSVCNFMKLSKEQQINRKGFALVWEY